MNARSWSPDGAHITASNATNNDGYVFIAAVIARNSWTSEISLVGHENTVEVAVRCVHNHSLNHLVEANRPGIQPAHIPSRPKSPCRGVQHMLGSRPRRGRPFRFRVANKISAAPCRSKGSF